VTFRGYMTLNGAEIANSSRVAAASGVAPPTSDVGILGGTADCSLAALDDDHPLLGVPPADSVPISDGSLLYTAANGSRMYSSGLAVVGDCWDDTNLCIGCLSTVEYDDSWDGLGDYLQEAIWRPELAPWYSTQIPESAEFGGIWLMDVKGLDVSTVDVQVTEVAGDGGIVQPPRDSSRKISFSALLVACTSAGLQYGLQWVTCQLRAANTAQGYGKLRYLAAHPGHSAVDPASLERTAYGVVMTQAPTVSSAFNAAKVEGQQATVYLVSWELTMTIPRVYLAPVDVPVTWDSVTSTPIEWVHATDCGVMRKGCDPNPKLFSTECVPVTLDTLNIPPPTCGGCMPVCEIAEHIFEVPAFDWPLRCRETAVTIAVKNTGDTSLNLQGYFRRCNLPDDCDPGIGGGMWPFQLTGLPPTALLTLDAITGRPTSYYHGRARQPVGIVGTPSGAPWMPTVMDRSLCWELVVITPTDAEFTVDLTLADREA
jgi:hypothetical protein